MKPGDIRSDSSKDLDQVKNDTENQDKIKDFSGRIDKALIFIERKIAEVELSISQNKAYAGNESYFEYDLKRFQSCERLFNDLLSFIKEPVK